MKKSVSGRFIAVLVVLVLCFLSIAIYTGATEGEMSLLSNITGTITAPAKKMFATMAQGIAGGYNYMFNYTAMEEENQQLKKALSEAEGKIREAGILEEENKKLRLLTGIKERNKSFEFEIAEVIGRNTGNWAKTITLDKGSTAGVEADDLVITEDGMLGYVSEVGLNFCEITTVVDTEMQAGAIVTRTRDVAVVEGDFELMENGLLKLSYLSKDSDIVMGDTVETSGTGGIFPKGILIGSVERILPEAHGISNYAVIKPSVDVDKTKKVFIIKSFEIVE